MDPIKSIPVQFSSTLHTKISVSRSIFSSVCFSIYSLIVGYCYILRWQWNISCCICNKKLLLNSRLLFFQLRLMERNAQGHAKSHVVPKEWKYARFPRRTTQRRKTDVLCPCLQYVPLKGRIAQPKKTWQTALSSPNVTIRKSCVLHHLHLPQQKVKKPPPHPSARLLESAHQKTVRYQLYHPFGNIIGFWPSLCRWHLFLYLAPCTT